MARRRHILLLGVVSLAGFVLLAATYDCEPLVSMDTDVAGWVATDLPHVLELAARPFSWLGGWVGLTVLGVVIAVVLVRERAWADLVFLAAALIGSNLAVSLLKGWIERDRPDVAPAVSPCRSLRPSPAGTQPRVWQGSVRSQSSPRTGCRSGASARGRGSRSSSRAVGSVCHGSRSASIT